MNANSKALLLVIICTLFTAAGQIFYKLSSDTFELNFIRLLTNWNLLIGLFLYFLGALLLIAALKFGELSKIYPFISLTFIWVFVLGVILFKDSISTIKVLGTVAIIAGVSFIGRS